MLCLLVGNQACGGDDDDDDHSDDHGGGPSTAGCEVKSPCGGDIKGDWKVANVCYDEAALSASAKTICPDATLKVTGVDASGDISYKTDGMFTQGATSVKATAEWTLGASCLRGATCELVQSQVEMSSMGAGPTTCSSASGGGCLCKSELSDSSQAMGTYTVSDNTVMLKSGDQTETQAYCVKGSTLVLLPGTQEETEDLPARVVLTRK